MQKTRKGLGTIESAATATMAPITRKTFAFHSSSLSEAPKTFRPKPTRIHLFHWRRLPKLFLMTISSTLTDFFTPPEECRTQRSLPMTNLCRQRPYQRFVIPPSARQTQSIWTKATEPGFMVTLYPLQFRRV